MLVDAARGRTRKKRGGGVPPVTLDEDMPGVDAMAGALLALDEALERLAISHPRPARALECRYFGGLTVEETAAALEVSPRTVDRDLVFAPAWLGRELGA